MIERCWSEPPVVVAFLGMRILYVFLLFRSVRVASGSELFAYATAIDQRSRLIVGVTGVSPFMRASPVPPYLAPEPSAVLAGELELNGCSAARRVPAGGFGVALGEGVGVGDFDGVGVGDLLGVGLGVLVGVGVGDFDGVGLG